MPCSGSWPVIKLATDEEKAQSAGATFRHGAAGLPRLGAVGRHIQFSASQGRTSRYEVTVITGAQIRQARELLGWEPFNLAQRAKVHSLIVERAESVACEPPITTYQAALIKQALVNAGVEFTNGDGPCVKLNESEGEDAEVRGAGLRRRNSPLS